MRRMILLALGAAATLAACGDNWLGLGPDDPAFARGGLTVEIVDPPGEVIEGDSAELTARVTNPGGRPVGAGVTWTSSAPDVATVTAEGRLTALAPGTADIAASVRRFEDAFVLTVKENPPPVAAMEDPETPEDTPIVFALEATDANDPAESLRAFIERVPGAGHLYQVNEDGTIDRERGIVIEDEAPAEVTNAARLVGWDPPADVHGEGETIGSGFTYHVRDPRGARSASHDGVIDVTPVPDAPVAADAEYSTDEDEALEVDPPGVLAGDTDADGDALAAAVVEAPSHGTLTLEADGSFSYAPEENFNGTDTFTYEAADGTGLSDTATVTIRVADVNDAPVSAGDSYETDEDETLEVAAPGVLENDVDDDGDALTVAVADGPSHGDLALSDDGSFSYTPEAGFSGEDAFTYTANDGTADGNAAVVTITVHADDPIDAQDDAYVIKEHHILTVPAPGVLDNDGGGGALTASLVSGPAKGKLNLEADGSFTYAPPDTTPGDEFPNFPNYDGVHTFKYAATDGASTHTATVTLEVTPNHKPVAEMERPVGIEDTPVIFELEGHDPDGEQDTLRVYVTEAPLFGEMYQVREDGTCDYDDQIFGVGDTITLVKNSDGLVCYVPPKDVAGDGSDVGSSFVYFVRDQHNSTSTSLLSFVDVEGVNDAPVAAPTVHTGFSDLEVSGLTLDFDDVDVGDQLTGVITRFPENGRVYRSFVKPENEITPENPTFPSPGIAYSYELNSVGEPFDSFEWHVTDGEERSETIEDVINIVDRNEPPNPVCPDGTLYDETGHPLYDELKAVYPCSPTDVHFAEDSPNFIRLSAIDEDDSKDGQNVRFLITSIPETGILRNSSNTIITADSLPHVLPSSFFQFGWRMSYFPAENYNNEGAPPDSFTYTVYDVRFDDFTNQDVILDYWPDTLTVRIHIEAVNDAPIAGDDAYATDEDTPLHVSAPGVLGNDTDAESEPMSAVLASGPSHGTLELEADGSFSYTPEPGFWGTDSFSYRASDGEGEGEVATVTLSVRVVNIGPPESGDDAYDMFEDGTLSVSAPGVLSNDTDADGDALTVALVSGPSNGIFHLDDDGSFSYSPDAHFNGVETFTYTANDGVVDGNTATATITVQAVEDAPVAGDDAYETAHDTPLEVPAPGVLGNDSDADGDVLRAALASHPLNGRLDLNDDGSFRYTPLKEFNGTDTFTYQAKDQNGASNTATVTITVHQFNLGPPVSKDDAYETLEDEPLSIAAPGVLENDGDPDGNPLTAVLIGGPSSGSLQLEADGSFSYSPHADFNGSDSFTYRAHDGVAAGNLATVAITIHPVEDAPVAVNDDYQTPFNTQLVVTAPGVLANDRDAEGDPLSVGWVEPPRIGGEMVMNDDGSFRYTPPQDFHGFIHFVYKAMAGSKESNTATVAILVRPPGE